MNHIKWAIEDRWCKWELFDQHTGNPVIFVPFKWLAVLVCKRAPAALDYELTVM